MTEKKVKKPGKRKKKPIVRKVRVEKKEIEVLKKPAVKRTYYFAVGRRKRAVAGVRIHKTGDSQIIINGLVYKEYFPQADHQLIIEESLTLTNHKDEYNISIKVQGGGKRGQAESCRLGISRILAKLEPEQRKLLKRAKLLVCDARVKERKKYGLKRARRAPQWQKR